MVSPLRKEGGRHTQSRRRKNSALASSWGLALPPPLHLRVKALVLWARTGSGENRSGHRNRTPFLS